MDLETCQIFGQVSHNLLYWKKNPPDGYMWSRVRLTRKQHTSRPDHLWPELWKSMGKHAKLKEKQKWSNDKLHLENARNCEGSISSTRRTRNSKKPLRMRVRSWKHQSLLLCPRKIMKKELWEWWIQQSKNKTCVYSGSWWIYEDCVWEVQYRIIIKNHIAVKGENSLQHYNLVHKFIPMPQAKKIHAAKAAVDKEWE